MRRVWYWREHYAANREREKAKVRRWRLKHPNADEATKRAWNEKNRVRNNRVRAAWLKRTGKIAIYNNNRRERRLAVESCDPVSANLLTQIIHSLPKVKCAICHRNMLVGDRTIDHVIPLSKGGTGHIGNLQIVHGKCNSMKQTKMPEQIDGQVQLRLVG